jgi:hypothetical protein
MTTIRRIPTSKIDGNGSNSTNTDEIRPYGEIAVYVGNDNKLELLMFDGNRTHVKSKVLNKGTFYGGDADSADGYGLDTIKLVPDAELYNNGNHQYLIVDPTAPNHIHLRPGGTIDQSNADLFLGGELNHVRVSDSYNNVSISTAIEGGTRSWLFSNDGALTTPGNINLKNTLKIEASDVNDLYDAYQGNLFILEDRFNGATYTGLGYPASKNSYEQLQRARALNPLIPANWIPIAKTLEDSYYSWAAATANLTANASGFYIQNGDGVGWRFEESTGILFPDNTRQTTAWNGVAPIARKVRAPNEATIEVTSTGNPDKIWNFSSNGDLTLPNGTLVRQNISDLTTYQQTYNVTVGYWDNLKEFDLMPTADAQGITVEGWPFLAWDLSGGNPQQYLTQLNEAWAVQNTPSSPPSPLIFNPPISAALRDQMRATLIMAVGAWDTLQSAISTIDIVAGNTTTTIGNGKLTTPEIIQTTPEEDLVIRTRFEVPSSPPGSGPTYFERNFTFGTNGTLTFPNGTVQTGASIELSYLKSIVASSTSFEDFKNRIAAL